MKTRILILLAAALLGSASAFAQSNTNQIKGDVNGDGIVNDADIKAVLQIMRDGGGAVTVATTYKWHIGTTSPDKTSWSESDFNQTSQSPITSFTAVTSNPFTIWIVPNSWGTVSSMKIDGETRNQWQTPVPWITSLPSGYTAYYSNFSRNAEITDITWSETYKWHIGTTSPDKTSWSESDFNQTSQSPITSFTAVTSNPFTIWIVPNSWGTVSSMKTGGELRNQWITPVPWNPTLPTGYTAYYTQFSADTPITDITWSETYYWYVGNSKPSSIDTNNIKSSATEIGWHNMDASASVISVGQCAVSESSTWYVCIPVINNSAFTKVLSGGIDVTSTFNVSTESIGGKSYTIFQSIETSKKLKKDFSK